MGSPGSTVTGTCVTVIVDLGFGRVRLVSG
jgi:hypothetical protein